MPLLSLQNELPRLSLCFTLVARIAIWERKLSVVMTLGVLCLAHWGILWRGMFIVDAKWDTTQGACVVNSAKHVFLNVGFFTSTCHFDVLLRCRVYDCSNLGRNVAMGVDFVTLCFTMFALLRKHHAKSQLWNLLFRDGLVYFVITFACNAAPAVRNAISILIIASGLDGYSETQVLNVLNLNGECSPCRCTLPTC